jgi:hypothetical protein
MKPAGARIVVVLGMHRSGTSLITRSLQVLGASLGDRLMPPADGVNAKGFFEDIDINALNIALMAELGSAWQAIAPIAPAAFERLYRDGWVEKALDIIRAKASDGRVFGFKDPRTAQLLPFWLEVFRVGGFEVKYLLALRNPASVADSLVSRDKMPRERSYYLWLEHTLNSLTRTADSAPALVDYDDFFGDADQVLEQMAAALGLAVDAAERDAFKSEFIDDTLRHTVHSDADLSADPSCPPLVVELYRGLKDAARDCVLVDSPQLRASIARWNAELERSRPALRLADIPLAAPVQAAPEAAAFEILKAVAGHAPELLNNIFDRKWYSEAYPDVIEAGVEPYRHYSEHGVYESRCPGPDVVQSAQRALDELVGARETSEERMAYLDQARRDEGHWADMMELQRASRERERSSHEELQRVQRDLQQALERRAEREAAWVAREREAAQAVGELVRRHLAELDDVRRAGTERELRLAEQREHADAEIRGVLAEAAEREAASAAAVGAMQREQAERVAALTQLADQRYEEHQRQMQAARDRVETLLHQLADLESRAQQREATLQAERTLEIARLQREREEEVARLLAEREKAEAGWRAGLADTVAGANAALSRGEEDRAALAKELDRVRGELDAIHSSVAWRVLTPFTRRRT